MSARPVNVLTNYQMLWCTANVTSGASREWAIHKMFHTEHQHTVFTVKSRKKRIVLNVIVFKNKSWFHSHACRSESNICVQVYNMYDKNMLLNVNVLSSNKSAILMLWNLISWLFCLPLDLRPNIWLGYSFILLTLNRYSKSPSSVYVHPFSTPACIWIWFTN